MSDNVTDSIQRELTRLIGVAELVKDANIVIALLTAKIEIGKGQR